MTQSCEEALNNEAPQNPNKLNVLVVAAAIIDLDGRVLIAQRPKGKSMAGLWEFPGGKVQKNEAPEYALMRELKEELGIETRPCCFTPAGFSSHEYEDFHLLMPLFICRNWKNTPQGREGQSIKWIRPLDLYEQNMPPADLPLIDSLLSLL